MYMYTVVTLIPVIQGLKQKNVEGIAQDIKGIQVFSSLEQKAHKVSL